MQRQLRGKIYFLEEGKYQLVVHTGWDEQKHAYGRQRRIYYGTLRQAEAYLRDWLYDLEHPGEVLDPDTVGEWLDFWLENDTELLLSWEQNTRKRAKGIVEHNIKPNIGSVPLAQLNADSILKLYKKLATDGGRNGKALSARSIKYVHTILNQALNQAVVRNKISSNPAKGLTPAAGKTRSKEKWVVLDKYQLKTFLEKIVDHRDYSIIYTAAYTGMRQSELLGLTWGKVERDEQIIRVTTTLHKQDGEKKFEHRDRTKNVTSTRTVDVTERVLAVLDQHREKQKEKGISVAAKALVFTDPGGKPMDNGNLTHRFKTLAKKHGHKGMTFHHLRHTHATILLSDGAYINEVSARLGHADPRITLAVYGHVLPNRMQSLAARFDNLLD